MTPSKQSSTKPAFRAALYARIGTLTAKTPRFSFGNSGSSANDVALRSHTSTSIRELVVLVKSDLHSTSCLPTAENDWWTPSWSIAIDRFARSLRQLVNALEEFRSLGIDFISIHEGVDTCTPNGRLVFGMFARPICLCLLRMSNPAQTTVTWGASVEVCFQPNRREAETSLAALQNRGMVKRIAPIRVIPFFLLVGCGALCQSVPPSADLLQRDGSNSPEVQRQEIRTWRSLPDAPSTVQPLKQAERLQTFAYEARSLSRLGAAGISSGVRRGPELRYVTPRPQPRLIAPYESPFTKKESSNFVVKYLCPPLVKRNLRYHPSTSSTFMGRTTYAASRIFISRDDSGKKRVNTSYFLGVLTSVAAQTAHRPYWTRSPSAPFNDFGSTIGSDAGFNLLHEFGPGIRQMVKGHTPRFVSKFEERITHDQNLKEVVSSPAR